MSMTYIVLPNGIVVELHNNSYKAADCPKN